MKNLLTLLLISTLSSCTVFQQNKSLVIESLKTIGKEKLKDVLKLSDATLQKDSIVAIGVYQNDYLIRKLGKGFTTAVTGKGFIEADTKRFNAKLCWFPAGDTTNTFTNIEFSYIKKDF